MCRTIKNGLRIPVCENKRSFVFLNPGRESHELVQVDGCAIKIGLRCDWAMLLSSGREVYIELKGTDLNHAYDQVVATVPKISKNLKSAEKVFCLIGTRIPEEDTSGQRMRLLLKKKFGIKTFKRSRTMEASEEDLFQA